MVAEGVKLVLRLDPRLGLALAAVAGLHISQATGQSVIIGTYERCEMSASGGKSCSTVKILGPALQINGARRCHFKTQAKRVMQLGAVTFSCPNMGRGNFTAAASYEPTGLMKQGRFQIRVDLYLGEVALDAILLSNSQGWARSFDINVSKDQIGIPSFNFVITTSGTLRSDELSAAPDTDDITLNIYPTVKNGVGSPEGEIMDLTIDHDRT